MNKVFLGGHLVSDPESRTTKGGADLVNIRMGVARSVKKGTSWETVSDFFTLAAFDHSANYLFQYGRKGYFVSVEASVRNNTWTDRDGKTHYDMSFVIEKVHHLSPPARQLAASRQESAGVSDAPPPVSDEDLLLPDRDDPPAEAFDPPADE